MNKKNSMKQTTKNILGIGAVVLLSAGVAGVTTYTMLKPENRDSLSFIKKIGEMCREMFCFHAGFCRMDKEAGPGKNRRGR